MSTGTKSHDAIAPGSVVVVRDEEWLVTATDETADGLLVHAQGLGELVRDVTASFYESLEEEIRPLDPADAEVVSDPSPYHRTTRLWLESTIRKTPVPLDQPDLTVSLGALATPLAYQQTAVRKALDPANLRPRILLADAVGLGKTLEIGMILSELVRRGRGERILVVTPRHVLEQMQHEMWSRFALPFVRLDSAGIQRVRQKLPATRNPFTYYKRVIISIDTLKSDQYVANLRKQRWDAVVIDESHNLSNSATLNNRLARLLARTTDALILASATPHNGRAESFAELIRLLDPTAVTPSGELVAEEVERLVVRRHRHSPEVASVVGADWAERLAPVHIPVEAGDAENAVARELEETWLFPRGGRSPYSGQNASLFPWLLAKAFLSSPAALAQSISERQKRLSSPATLAKTIRERQQRLDVGDDGRGEDVALQRLAGLTAAAEESGSSKYEALVAHLRDIGVGPGSATRAVVFAERVPTLEWLTRRLPGSLDLDDEAVVVMHGGLSDEVQQRIVDEFKQSSTGVRVLVTGDIASEGVNLHAQCHHLVHFDIPWSLIRIEQRNGRIDRFGQKQRPQITTLLLVPDSDRFAGDVRVLARLVDKEHEAHAALGDAASLMGQYDVKGEEDEIRKVLAGQKDLDDVVRSVEQVQAGQDLTALFARLTASPATPAEGASTPTNPPTTGLFPDDAAFLDEALHAAYEEAGPAAPAVNGGVEWRWDDAFGTAQLVPPRDLVQRLEVLPQSYLAERRVTDQLVLATTQQRGDERLRAALSDAQETSWPDAHYLAPLHPVLDWAADRALSRLGRNQVFAIRSSVDAPTVLLVGTLTNRRGQAVAASWLTVEFPSWTTSQSFVRVHPSARVALAELGLDNRRPNSGVLDVSALQQYVRPAVRSARAHMASLFGVNETNVQQRVDDWSKRLQRWEEEADTLLQRKELKQRRVSVEEERRLVGAMAPDRQLVRPLLLVISEENA